MKSDDLKSYQQEIIPCDLCFSQGFTRVREGHDSRQEECTQCKGYGRIVKTTKTIESYSTLEIGKKFEVEQ